LTSVEVQQRQAQYGPNELIERGGRTLLVILWEQLTATMVLILIAAAIVAGSWATQKTLWRSWRLSFCMPSWICSGIPR